MPSDDIAIIGMGCRFPGRAHDPSSFWSLLSEGRDVVGEVPDERWDPGLWYHPDPSVPGRIYTRAAGCLDDGIDGFDPESFGLSAREAAHMDPQHRLLLEVAWEALEDAGVPSGGLAGGDTSVFVGVCSMEYGEQIRRTPDLIDVHTNVGGSSSLAANRISYCFDLHGPSVALDTACSSSLVAVHLACESLRSGRSPLALAGGVNLLVNPETSVGFCKASMLSRTGRCYAFDARADGFVRAEGAAVVVLKPLRDAVAGGDRIYAVIRGTGVNQDGRTNGISLPSETSQRQLIRRVLAESGVSPTSVQYVEAHGTGTPVGDPIECSAIGTALGEGRDEANPCRIGSVKTNLGHTEGASGMAGLVKLALSLHRRQIPPNLHFETPNPKIDFAALKLSVQQSLEAWPENGAAPRTGSINSFGFGGTNAHAILVEAPVPAAPVRETEPGRAELLVASARSAEALRARALGIADWLDSPSTASPREVCASAALRREPLEHRLAVVGHSRAELADALRDVARGTPRTGASVQRSSSEAPAVAFVFSGNGPQWWGMGRQLLAREPVFREAVERCDRALVALGGGSVRDALGQDEQTSRMARTSVAQPALFAIQYGLSELWSTWGIRPAAVVGHSVGEVAAALVAGVLTFDDAVRVVHHRSRMQEQTAGRGRMAAVGLSARDARERLRRYEGGLTLAAVNAPGSVTIAGDEALLAAFGVELEPSGIFFRLLRLDYAFHSPEMDPIRDELLRSLRDLDPRPAAIPFVSTVTGAELADRGTDADYWWRNVRSPVLFEAAIRELLGRPIDLVLEIGPHPVLAGYVSEIAADLGRKVGVLPSLHRRQDDRASLLGTMGALHVAGVRVGWEHVYPGACAPVGLPLYPWQRKPTRVVQASPEARIAGPLEHPLLGRRLPLAEPTWQNDLDVRVQPYLADHRLDETIVFPGAGQVEVALAAARSVLGDVPCELEELDIRKPLIVPPGTRVRFQTVMDPGDHGLTTYSRAPEGGETWTAHATCRLRRLPQDRQLPPVDLGGIRARLPHQVDPEVHFRETARWGLNNGPAFRGLVRLWVGTNEALGEVHQTVAPEGHRFHPTMLDGCFQVILSLIPVDPDRPQPAYLPVRIERFRLHRSCPPVVFCGVRLRKLTETHLRADCVMCDAAGEIVAEIDALHAQAVDLGARSESHLRYGFRWEPANPAPGPLAPPSQILDAARPAVAGVFERLGRARFYDSFLPRTDRLCAAYVWRALRGLGTDLRPGARISVPALLASGQAPEHVRAWLPRLLGMLEARGALVRKGDTWEVAEPACALPDPVSEWQALASELPAWVAELVLLRRFGLGLAGILRGEIEPLELLFSDRDDMAEHVYDAGPYFSFYNTLAQEAVAALVRRLPPGGRLRVLEIGAGTGGTTASILAALPADRVAYTFTDVSDALLARSRVRFQQHPSVAYRRLDIEQDPVAQGFPAHGFDLVVASNVLHATRSLDRTLTHVRRLLASEGQLLLLEIFEGGAQFIDLVFGALPGFWRFEDRERRSGHCLLGEAAWRDVLRGAGFGEIGVLHDGDLVARPEQGVILARAPQIAPEVAPPTEPGAWLVVAGDNRFAGHVIGRLETLGHRVCVFGPGGAAAALDTSPLTGVLDLSALDSDGARGTADEPPDRCADTLPLVRALLARTGSAVPRLCVVTSGSETLPDEPMGDAGLFATPLWGFVRVLRNEHPELRALLVDVGVDPGSAEAASLVAELSSASDPEVLVRGSDRFVHRLHPVAPGAHHGSEEASSFRLEIPVRGLLDRLVVRRSARPAPGPGEVEIEVRAAGLNFKDVMWATGMLSGEAMDGGFAGASLGFECAGIVTRVGSGTTAHRPGDEVFGFAPWSFGRFTRTRADAMAPKPPALTFEEAATVPVAFLTAWYGLHQLAQLAPGERVLVHGAAGGVGLAAVQIVRLLGGTVLATAGTTSKRELLRALGIAHVFDSRSLAFADDVRAVTDGEGVDVVLNFLSGEAVGTSLGLLRPFGRFVEIGKRDFLDNNKMGLRPFLDNLSYFALDADRLLSGRPDLVRSMLGVIGDHLAQGRLRPLFHRTFPLAGVRDAFRQMQHSRHVGKVIVSMQRRGVDIAPEAEVGVRLRADGTYLVTGGLGGFGLALARWTIERGAGRVVLASRSGAGTDEVQRAVAALQDTGATVEVARLDVTRRADLDALLDDIRRSGPPLRGVFHAAMVLDDGAILKLDAERLNRVQAPKIRGAWNLHGATAGDPLDHFVLFSSVSAVAGTPGQAGYAAANAFLDGLSRHRIAAGRPALSVNWGVIGDVGYVSRRSDDLLGRLSAMGAHPLPVSEALRELGGLMGSSSVPPRVVADIDWVRWATLHPETAPILGAMRVDGGSDTPGEGEPAVSEQAFRALLRDTPSECVPRVLQGRMVEQLARVLRSSGERVDVDVPLSQLGLDSLMAVELRLRIQEDTGVDVQVMALLQGGSLAKLAESLVPQVVGDAVQDAGPDPVDRGSHRGKTAGVSRRYAT